jgi:hypothetical protein
VSRQPQRRQRIPADVDREDRLLAGLTARQLAILTFAGLAAWAIILAVTPPLPLPVAAALAAPVGAAGAVLALGRRDGLPADRLTLAALQQRLAPRRQVLAPEGVVPAPAWAVPPGAHPALAPLGFPAREVGDGGVVDLGPDGAALVCLASPVNFSLRTPAEQDALIAAFARVLNAVTAPLQIVVRAERVDLRGSVAALRERAGGLPHPALEAACHQHAGFLEELAGRRDVLRRQVLLVLREPTSTPTAAAAPTLRRRAEDTAAGLAAAGIQLTPLDSQAAAEVLRQAADPLAPARPAGLAPPEAIITRAGGTP